MNDEQIGRKKKKEEKKITTLHMILMGFSGNYMQDNMSSFMEN
jgi:hypothetical protein